MFKLSDISKEDKFKIMQFDIDIDSRHRLLTMGVHSNDLFVRLNESKFGPILIKNLSNNATSIAVGRDLAERIYIELE